MNKIITNNEQETFNFGLELGRKCLGGEVFVLSGNLGAGKTKLTQGLAQGLRVKAKITSPTFNILKLYNLSGSVKRFCHIDAYRLRSAADLAALGVQEFFESPDTVTVIEWADKVKKIWPSHARSITIKSLGPQEREIICS